MRQAATAMSLVASSGVLGVQFYSDPNRIDRQAIEAFRDFGTDEYCNGYWKDVCDPNGDPICGNDDWTYNGPCDFRKNFCMGNYQLRFKHWGVCGMPDNMGGLFANDWVETGTTNEEPGATEEEPEKRGCMKLCTKERREVCGSNGKTYSNKCMLEIETCRTGVKLAYIGACEAPEYEEEPEESPLERCPDNCDNEHAPVCGSDNETYRNLCAFRVGVCRNGITLKSRGACGMANDVAGFRDPCMKGCPRIYDPVCDNMGETHSTMCELEIAHCRNPEVEFARYGNCAMANDVGMNDMWNFGFRPPSSFRLPLFGRPEPREPENDKCNFNCLSETLKKVCGEHNNRYEFFVNKCSMEQMSCQLYGNPNRIKQKNSKKCNKRGRREVFYSAECDVPEICSTEPSGLTGNGICGTDGLTYSNECELRKASCESGQTVQILYSDHCEAYCSLNSGQMDMQCGSNGLTYWNQCMLDQFNYLQASKNPSTIEVTSIHAGACGVTEMLNDWAFQNNNYIAETPEFEEEEEEDEDAVDARLESREDPYSPENCARRLAENSINPCSSFDAKQCYSDGNQYSLCQFRLAKCDKPDLVLAMNNSKCLHIRGFY